MKFGTFIITVLLGTIALAQEISFDFDRATDFTAFKRYAWVRGTAVNDEINHTRIVSAVNTELGAKGLIQVRPDDSPDVLVAYHATFDKDLQINGFSSGWGGYRFAGSRTGSARAEEILVGTLVIDVVNARTKQIVWRGMASKDIDVKASPDKREKNINRATQKLFKNYPPKGK